MHERQAQLLQRWVVDSSIQLVPIWWGLAGDFFIHNSVKSFQNFSFVFARILILKKGCGFKLGNFTRKSINRKLIHRHAHHFVRCVVIEQTWT